MKSILCYIITTILTLMKVGKIKAQAKLHLSLTTVEPLISICSVPRTRLLIALSSSKFYVYDSNDQTGTVDKELVENSLVNTGGITHCTATDQALIVSSAQIINYNYFPAPPGLPPGFLWNGNPSPYGIAPSPRAEYKLSDWVSNTTFILVTQTTLGTGFPVGIYQAMRIDEFPFFPVIQYSLAGQPIGMAFKNGTSHFIVSYSGATRQILDYSNPLLDLGTHTKLNGATKTEYVVATPAKNRNFYVSGIEGGLEIVKFSDTSVKSEVDISSFTDSINDLQCLPFSDYVVVLAGNGKKFAIINTQNSNEAFKITEFGDAGIKTKMAVVKEKRLIGFADSVLNKLMIYEIEQYSCHPSCKTCMLGIEHYSCTSCRAGEGITLNNECAPTHCQPNEHVNELTNTPEKCLKCGEGCLACNRLKCTLCQNPDAKVNYLGNCIDCSINTEEVVCNYQELYFYPTTKEIDSFTQDIFFSSNYPMKLVFEETLIHGYDFDPTPVLKITYRDPKTGLEREFKNWKATGYLLDATISFQEVLPSDISGIKIYVNRDGPWLKTDNFARDIQLINKVFELKRKTTEDKIKEALESQIQQPTNNLNSLSTALKSGGLVSAGLGFIFNRFLFFLVKYFQILDVLSNFEKINVKFGESLQSVFDFVGSIEFPSLPTSFIDLIPDEDAYLRFRRGQRGKLGMTNEDTFILYGQNGVYAFITIILWSILMVREQNLKKKTRVSPFKQKYSRISKYSEGNEKIKAIKPIDGFMNKNKKKKQSRRGPCYIMIMHMIFKFVYDVNYFDFQFIASSEISYHDIKKGGQSIPLMFSILVSWSLIVIIILSLIQAWSLIRRRFKEEELEKLSYYQLGLYSGFTETLSDEARENGCLVLLFENLRFFGIQILITSLQLLNKVQITLILATDIAYFIYFIREIRNSKTKNIFESNFMKWKYIIQEASILYVLTSITVFVYCDSDKFRQSSIYSILEMLVVAGVIFTCFAELGASINSIARGIQDSCNNRRKKTVEREKKLRDGLAQAIADILIPDIKLSLQKSKNGRKRYLKKGGIIKNASRLNVGSPMNKGRRRKSKMSQYLHNSRRQARLSLFKMKEEI